MSQIRWLINNAPDDSFIPNDLIFEFVEKEGTVRYSDFIMAGQDFYGFEFISGPYSGRKIFCRQILKHADESLEFYYSADYSSDGMVFNRNPARPIGPDEETEDANGDWGGGYFPEWDGHIFTIKETDEIGELA